MVNVMKLFGIKSLLLSAALMLISPVFAQSIDNPNQEAPKASPAKSSVDFVVLGRDFTKYEQPLRTSAKGNQIEVLYFFWYGSPWAARVDQELRVWARSQPFPIRFVPTPVSFDPTYGPVATRIFYALERLGKEETVGPLFLQAVHKKHVNLSSPKSVLDWMEAQDIPPEKFQQALNHVQTRSRAAATPHIQELYQIKSVPALVINGTYQIRAYERMPPERFLEVSKFFITKMSEPGPKP